MIGLQVTGLPLPRSTATGILATLPPRIVWALGTLATAFAAARARGPIRDAAWQALQRVDAACLSIRVSGGDGFTTALAEGAIIEARELFEEGGR